MFEKRIERKVVHLDVKCFYSTQQQRRGTFFSFCFLFGKASRRLMEHGIGIGMAWQIDMIPRVFFCPAGLTL